MIIIENARSIHDDMLEACVGLLFRRPDDTLRLKLVLVGEPLTEATTNEPGSRSRQRVAVVIPAKDESRRIAATVRAARAIPRVDLVLVRDQMTVIFTKDSFDITGEVIKRYNAKHK